MTSLAKFAKKISGRQDGDAAKRAQRQEILISRDDVSSPSLDCQFEKLVILGVSAVPQSDRRDHVLSIANVGCKKLEPLVLAYICREFWPSQHIVQFFECCFGNQQPPTLPSRVKGSSGRRSKEHQRADNNVGVEDDAHINPRRVSTRAIRASDLLPSPHALPRPKCRRAAARAESSALGAAAVTATAAAVADPQTRIDRRRQSRHPREWR